MRTTERQVNVESAREKYPFCTTQRVGTPTSHRCLSLTGCLVRLEEWLLYYAIPIEEQDRSMVTKVTEKAYNLILCVGFNSYPDQLLRS